MTVAELIEKLLEFPQHLPACQVGICEPSELRAEEVILERDEHYWINDKEAIKGDFVQIG